MTYKAQEEHIARAAQQRNDDLPKLINFAQEPINLTKMCALMKKSSHYVSRILAENTDKFTNLGAFPGSNQILYQATVKANKVVVTASTVYHLHDDKRYHENMKLLRDNRKSAITYISGSILSCNY